MENKSLNIFNSRYVLAGKPSPDVCFPNCFSCICGGVQWKPCSLMRMTAGNGAADYHPLRFRLVLASPETATDTDYSRIEGVVGHEYFHNWTGNRVTCRDWFQLTLKEGLTVYRDQVQFDLLPAIATIRLLPPLWP